jgi:ribonuclease HI
MKGKIMKYIYTDGGCSGNPGPGGWGFAILDENNEIIEFGYGKKSDTTNNEMELRAILEAYRYTQKHDDSYVVYTDSAYCLNSLTNWMFGWERNGWIKSDKKAPKNLELFKELFEIFNDPAHAPLEKVSGHTGIIGNEAADALATGNLQKFDNLKNL